MKSTHSEGLALHCFRSAGGHIPDWRHPESDAAGSAHLLKALKRTMAVEYSRELGEKVFRGLARLASMGYKQGGSAGIGLRRLLIDEHGNPKQQLAFGERKSILTDRVVLIPGAEPEVKLVRQIFERVRDGRTPVSIADELDAKRVLGIRWSRGRIYDMLRNPKYIGTQAFNRKSARLQSRTVRNPVRDWILSRDGK